MKAIRKIFHYSAIGVFTVVMLCAATAGAELTLSDVQMAIQEKGADWIAGETSVSSLSMVAKARLAGVPQTLPREQLETWSPDPEAPIPIGNFDWRNKNGQNWITPVKNQNPCGTCWNYAAIGVLEAQINIDKNDSTLDIDLSEQMTLSCWSGHTPWCAGGWPSYTFQQARDEGGIPDEACFPDTCKTSGCPAGGRPCSPCSDWESRAWTISGYAKVSPNTTAAFKAALQYGPLAVSFRVPDDWYFYTSGVYKPTIESPEWEAQFPPDYANHCVVIVGYSDPGHDPNHPTGYWIVKNSWGPGWGMDGYGAVEYGVFEAYGDYQTLAGAIRVWGTEGPTPDGMPQLLYDDFNNAYIVANHLGMFLDNEWAVLGKVDLDGIPPDVGWGFAFFHPTNHDLCLHINRDNAWLSHSWEGVWGGNGTDFVLSTSALYHAIHPLWTSPPAGLGAIEGDPSAR